METLEEAKTIAGENQKRISGEFGSIDKLYKRIYYLYSEDARLYYESSVLQARMKKIQQELFEIEDRLDAIGINGIEVMGEIMKKEEEDVHTKQNNEEENMNKMIAEINNHLMTPDVYFDL